MMTFNVLEYCAAAANLPIVFSSRREVYGDVHRFEEYGEATADFAYTESTVLGLEDRRRGVHLLLRPLLRPARISSSASRTSTGATTTTCTAWCACCRSSSTRCSRGEPITVYGGAREDARLHLRRRLRRRDRARDRGARRAAASSNQTINLAYGQGNTLVHAAERIAGELGVEPQMTIAPSLLGEVTHYVADIRKARDLLGYDPQVPLDEGISARRRLVPRPPRRQSRGERPP